MGIETYHSSVRWLGVVIAALVALVAATAVAWLEIRQEREFTRLLAAGDAALAAGRTSEAIEAFSGALAFKPASIVAHLKRGHTYRRRGGEALDAALRDARDAHRLEPAAPQPLELLGDVETALGRYEAATAYYRQYLELDDRDARVLYKLASAHVQRGRPGEALDPLRSAIAIDEGFAAAHYLLGVALRALNRGDEAVRELRRSIALDAALIPPREELAELYAARGRVRDTIEQLEALAALEPDRPQRLVRVALFYARSGRHDTALVALTRAAERHPDSTIVSTALGRLCLEQAARGDAGAVTRALAALQPIARRPDVTSESLALLGRAELMAGRAADAERTLQAAVARQPVFAAAFRYLADAARRRGHAAAAREAEARYAALVPAT